jgi:tetratricopeptide (TPR) repeat protein
VLSALPSLARAQDAKPVRPDQPDEKDPDKERKRRAFALSQEGSARFDLGKFDEAIDLFQKAYEVYPYPEALYNIAQAYRMKKDYERAVFFYKSYLRNHPNAPNRVAVEARIQEMERLDAEQKASAKKPPQGTNQPPSPDGASGTGANLGANTGANTIGDASGATALGEPPPATPRESPAAWYSDGWGWTLSIGGALAVGGGSWLLGEAYSLDSSDLAPTDQIRVDEERADSRNRKIGWAIVGVGAAALVGGVVKLVVTDPGHEGREGRDRAHAARGVDLVVGPRWIGLAGTF